MDQSAPWRVLESQAPVEPPASGSAQAPTSVPWAVIAALVLAGVLAVAAFIAATAATPTSLSISDAAPANDPSTMAPAVASASRILVEVSGAVVSPGVYTLPPDARVSDAIDAAGGFGPRVDTARADRELNLAALLADGTEIHVASRDEMPPDTTTGMGTGRPGSTTLAEGAAGLVNVNRATAAELEALPGIGPATAAKIIAAREEQPFTTVDELRGRKVLGAATLAKVRDLVTVGP